jgi:hypothetical protein
MLRGGERQHIDAREIAVGAGRDQPLDRCRGAGIGALALCGEHIWGFAHGFDFTRNFRRNNSVSSLPDKRRVSAVFMQDDPAIHAAFTLA